MTRAEFRVAYRDARKVRRLERTYRDRLKDRLGFGLLSLGDDIPGAARDATFRHCDMLSMCRPHVGLTPRSRFNPTPRLPA